MKAFDYATALTPASAAELRGSDGRYLAGGIDLLGEMKEYIATPSRLVNVKKLPGTWEITKAADGGFSIGANATVAAVAGHPDLQASLPALAEAASEVGSPQIRAVATVGGNLAQHSRCWYYRQRDLSCLKRGGNTCYAREGQNKFSAIFSGNPCVSPVVSNLAVALAALDASAVVWREGKDVKLTMKELYQDAWNNPLAQNSLRPGDLILRVEVPPPTGTSAYLQVSEKSDFDWAMVSCAVAGKVADGRLSGVRIVLGSVAPVPYEAAAAAQRAEGQPLNAGTADAAADSVVREARPLAHNGYKVPMARTLIRRALLKLGA